MAGPNKNNMQENRIKSQFLYKIMDVILLFYLVPFYFFFFFLRKGEEEKILVF